MKLLRSVLLAAGFLASCVPAYAASVPVLTGPQDPSQLNATVNGVIANINAILSPLTGGTVAGAVNLISLTPAVTGGVATVGLQPGSDANAALGISPNGSGNIVLFPGGSSDAGVLQFGNIASFVSAPSLAAFPGNVPGSAAIQGVHSTLQGVVIIKDWLGVTRGIPAY